VDIFNLSPNKVHRFKILSAIFKYASESDQIDTIHLQIKKLDEWIYELELDNLQERQLLSSFLGGLENTPEYRDLSVRFLQTFKEEETLGEYEPLVEKQLLEFMRASSSEVLQLDELLVDCPRISTLKGKPVYELLEILTHPDKAKFKAFAEKNSEFLTESGLSVPDILGSISLGILTKLCSSKQTIRYDEVISALQIPEDEVEGVVIEAILQGLVDVRLNQPQRLILVRYARRGTYGEKEWKQLGERVDNFKANILELVEGLKSAKVNAQ